MEIKANDQRGALKARHHSCLPFPSNAAGLVLLYTALPLATLVDKPSVIIENTSLLKMNYASNAACKRKLLEKFKPAT